MTANTGIAAPITNEPIQPKVISFHSVEFNFITSKSEIFEDFSLSKDSSEFNVVSWTFEAFSSLFVEPSLTMLMVLLTTLASSFAT